ncbi:putative ribonuclease H-like domain-containing protein [Tanacetum coccineum]
MGTSKKRSHQSKGWCIRVLLQPHRKNSLLMKKEIQARTLLLMSCSKDHLRLFPGHDDANEIGAAIKPVVLVDALGASGQIRCKSQVIEVLPPAWNSLAMTLERRRIIDTLETDAGYYDIPLYSRFKQVEYKGVPHPLSGDYTPREQEDIDDSLYEYGKFGPQPQSPSPTVDGELGTVTDHSVNDDLIHDQTPIPSIEQVTIATQKTQPQVPKPTQTVDPSCAQHVKSPRQPIRTPVTSSPIPSNNRQNWNQRMNRDLGKLALKRKRVVQLRFRQHTSLEPTLTRDHPLKHMEHRGIFDSGCSGHMTGNRAHLEDYQELSKVGSVTFGGSKGSISGKGTIRLGNLVFDDVAFVKELGHFNLFSISQICDKKLNVLFTEKECFVVSSDFKMPDENQVLLKVPRQHNMYTFDMKNVDSSKGYTCLLAKASSNEAKLWHRRLGHLNFKNLNKLVKDNLVRGLPSKSFKNDHTCVACQKGKQHKASCKAKIDRYVTHPLHTLHMDLFGPTSVRSINHASYCLVITDDCSRYYLVLKRVMQDQLGHGKENARCHLLIGCNLVIQIFSPSVSMAQLKYCDKHNQVGFLLKPTESAGYTEIVDFLRRSKLRYALTHNPPIYDSLVKQFWQTATARTLADGTQQLDATIDTIEYTITEESVRRQLQLADASGIHMLQNEEIFAGLQNIGYVNDRTFTFWKSHFTPQWRFLIHHILHCLSSKSGGWDQFGSNIAIALICLSTGRDFNFSKLIFDGMISNLKSKSKFLMYPRFLQMILNVQTENKNLFVPVSLTKKIFGNMKRSFQGIHRPLLPAMLTIDAGQPQPSAAPTPSHPVPTPTSSHVQITQLPSPPPPITSSPPPSTLTQPVQSSSTPPQPSSVQPTATTPPTQPVQTTSSPPVSTIPDIQPTLPPSPQIPSPSYHDTEGPSFEPSYHMSPPPSHEPMNSHTSRTSEESEQLRNLLELVPRLESRVESLEKELSDTKQTLGTAIIQLIRKVKKLENKLRQKRKSEEIEDEENAEGQDQEVPSQTDQGNKFATLEKCTASEGFKGSQAPLGSKIYRRKPKSTPTPTKILDFEEPAEKIDQRRIGKDPKDVKKTFPKPKFQRIKEIKSEKLQEPSIKTHADQILAENDSKEERDHYSKRIDQSFYMTRNCCPKKHAELKSKSIERSNLMYERNKKQDQTFDVLLYLKKNERAIKKMNEQVADKEKEQKDESVQEEVKEEEGAKKRKLGTRRKLKAKRRKYTSDKVIDVEILDHQYPIIEWQSFYLTTKPQFDPTKPLEDDYMNRVTRSNGNMRFFRTLMGVLSIFDREDLKAVYELVMEKYQDAIPQRL